MPRVTWGVSAQDIDNFDRESQYRPYDGPIPVNGVYQWKIKFLKHIAATNEKLPQLRIGLELTPRKDRKEEKKYAGYFVMLFPPVSPRTQFRYVPFLDAIGVSGKDFENRTIVDSEGNIKKIGHWGNTGKELILGNLKDDVDGKNNPIKTIDWMGPVTDEEYGDEEDDEEEYGDEEDDDEEYDEDDDGF